MASLKVKFRPSTTEGKEGVIYYQIIHNRITRLLKTNYRIYEHEWDGNFIHVINDKRKNFLLSLKECIEQDLKRLEMIVWQFENRKAVYTADDVVYFFHNRKQEQSFFKFIQSIIIHLKQIGKTYTTKNYSCTLKSFMKFRQNKDILLSE